MMASRSYSEPLRSHMRRRFWADVRTVAITGGIALLIVGGGITIGHAILKTALIVTVPPQIQGCC